MKESEVTIYTLKLDLSPRSSNITETYQQWFSNNRSKIEKKKEEVWKEVLNYYGIKREELEVECEHCQDVYIEHNGDIHGASEWEWIEKEYIDFCKNYKDCKDSRCIDGIFTPSIEDCVEVIESSSVVIKEGIEYAGRDLYRFPSLYIEEINVSEEVKM
jgi:hypothetical protein